MGDFNSRKEFECACWLDLQAQKGHIQFWPSGLVRRESSSFVLRKADGRFFPDFMCRLPDTENRAGLSPSPTGAPAVGPRPKKTA